MHQLLQEVIQSLDGLSQSVLSSSTEDRDFSQIHGWDWPSVNRHTLSNIPQSLSNKLKNVVVDHIEEPLQEDLEMILQSIENLRQNTLQYMFNGHGKAAIPAYITTLNGIESTLSPLLSWEVINDNKLLPAPLLRRLRSIQADLDNITPQKEDLESQVKLIQDATEAAENLPTDLQRLKEARKEVVDLAANSAELFGKIDSHYQDAEAKIKSMTSKREEADQIVKQASEAYRITTSIGLAASFDERAKSSSSSMWVWVVGLIISLAIGAFMGSNRLALLSNMLNNNHEWMIILMQIILSALSIGAPLWFAWIATKQINQRFRLSEDYAFKASVAKAYEGYRREAARIDPIFEARLFSSALERLEEAPIRLVEGDVHGSPWHELFTSKPFREALEIIPEFKDSIIQIMKNKLPELSKTEFSKLENLLAIKKVDSKENKQDLYDE